MAIAWVRNSVKTVFSDVSADATNSFSTKPAAGNFIAMYAGGYHESGYGFTSIADNQNNTVAADITSNLGASGIVRNTIRSVLVNAASGPATHTITLNHSQADTNFGMLVAAEFSGLATSSALDVSLATPSDSSLTDAAVGPTSVTAQADELAIAGATQGSGNAAVAFTTPTDYTEIAVENDATLYAAHQVSFRILAATGAQTVAWSHSNTNQEGWVAAVATYKAGASGPVTPVPTILRSGTIRSGTFR